MKKKQAKSFWASFREAYKELFYLLPFLFCGMWVHDAVYLPLCWIMPPIFLAIVSCARVTLEKVVNYAYATQDEEEQGRNEN